MIIEEEDESSVTFPGVYSIGVNKLGFYFFIKGCEYF